MKILPKGKFAGLLLIIMLYAYYNEYVVEKRPLPTGSVAGAPSNIAVVNKDELKASEPSKDETGLSAKIIDKVRENETGKAVLEALVKKSVQKKYGTDDIKVIAARETGSLTVIDSLRGTGEVLNCGAEAVINYDAFMSSGIKFDSTRLQDQQRPVTVQLGSGQVIKGLEMGLLGMHEGGRRKISIPSDLAFNSPGFTNTVIGKDEVISYDVELVEIKEGPYKTGFVPAIMSVTEGSGDKITCGDKVRVKYAFSSLEAMPVPETSGEVEFKLGNGSVPIGLEFALLDMKKGGRKTIQINHELLKTAKASIMPSKLDFDNDEVIRAEVEVLDVVN